MKNNLTNSEAIGIFIKLLIFIVIVYGVYSAYFSGIGAFSEYTISNKCEICPENLTLTITKVKGGFFSSELDVELNNTSDDTLNFKIFSKSDSRTLKIKSIPPTSILSKIFFKEKQIPLLDEQDFDITRPIRISPRELKNITFKFNRFDQTSQFTKRFILLSEDRELKKVILKHTVNL